MYSIRTVVLRSGERLPLLVEGGPQGSPSSIVTRYILTELRPRGLKPNTIRSRLRALSLGFQFCNSRGIDLQERVLSLKFLGRQEVIAFNEVCRMRQDGVGLVNPNEAVMRFRTLVRYLRWASEPVFLRISNAKERVSAHKLLDEFTTMAHSVAPRRPAVVRSNTQERYGLSTRQREVLLEAIEPGHRENPFQGALQIRNRALIELIYELGPRAGEVLSAKIPDLDFSTRPATWTILQRHGDPEDPRVDQPVAKTLERILALSDGLRDWLYEWIIESRADRSLFPNARKHPFLFVNRYGSPLSQRGFRKIFAKLQSSCPILKSFTAHALRHDWNDRWHEQCQVEGWDPAASEREQKYAMGWAPSSRMPERYARRAIRDSANKKILRMQTHYKTK